MLALITIAIAIAPSTGTVAAPSARLSQQSGDAYVCNYARVIARPSIRVHASPSGPIVGRLRHGAAVYICDANRDFYGVRYGRRRGEPCASVYGAGLDSRKAARCRSGWVRKHAIEVLSG